MPNEMDDLLSLVQPTASASLATEPPAGKKVAKAVPGLEGIDLSVLTESDLALLGPLMKLLDLSPEDAAALASQEEDGETVGDGGNFFEDVVEKDDLVEADAAVLAELAKLEEAELAAGSLEGNLDRLLARIEGLEGEIEPLKETGSDPADQTEAK